MSLFKKNNRTSSHTLKATYATLLNYRGEKSSHLHALSEYIDNSVSSYMKDISKEDGNVEGLEISIEIDSSKEGSQTITIIDNAGGMDEKELGNAMQPNNIVGKGSDKINQYGVGLKLASFYLGSAIEIVTRKKDNYEYALKIEITKENENNEAKFDIEERKDPEIFINNKTGTWIRVSNIYKNPNRKISGNQVFCKTGDGFGEISNGLGWRYCKLLDNGMKIKMIFNYGTGNSVQKYINSFLPKAYTLSSAKKTLEQNKNSLFNFETYKNNVFKNVENLYLKNKNEIDKLTGCKNFIETLKNDEPLFFDYCSVVEGKEIKIQWGILSLKGSGDNGTFNYNDLYGFTLLHKGRAIKHGPNQKQQSKSNGEVMISTFKIEGDSSGGNAVRRRIFGVIDLTGIEIPERNKSEFIWGETGKADIDEINRKILNVFKDILNAMAKEETNEEHSKVLGTNTTKNKEKISDSMVNNFSSLRQAPDVGNDYVKVTVDINGNYIEFKINHAPTDCNKEFIRVKKESNEKIIINLNTNHYLCKTFMKENTELNSQIKSELLYPLAISLAICEIQNKNNSSDIDFGEWSLTKERIEFADLLNNVLEKLKGKNE